MEGMRITPTHALALCNVGRYLRCDILIGERGGLEIAVIRRRQRTLIIIGRHRDIVVVRGGCGPVVRRRESVVRRLCEVTVVSRGRKLVIRRGGNMCHSRLPRAGLLGLRGGLSPLGCEHDHFGEFTRISMARTKSCIRRHFEPDRSHGNSLRPSGSMSLFWPAPAFSTLKLAVFCDSLPYPRSAQPRTLTEPCAATLQVNCVLRLLRTTVRCSSGPAGDLHGHGLFTACPQQSHGLCFPSLRLTAYVSTCRPYLSRPEVRNAAMTDAHTESCVT
ncbi:hypothetical protein EXIGLDRAFT_150523 [Exidia glandulosa HHB12029]|uniref:Uncharacterized protein n=1 Tax=Exidia glandulosa HHB12029 TaxID=1314781 RepID=A0A166A7B8_EXIGL|nr:hypothetical protein EXIGLDRAFT_150523 [Exidia glandulosa HHB12029]